MKGFIGVFLLLVFCSGFVFAASSEIESDFSVGVPTRPIENYVPPENFMGNYFGYFVLIFVALILVYFVVRQKKVSKKKVVSKKRKILKKKVTLKKKTKKK
jgi:uncharacterized BrkB/YihY/UPF0761 family membrane protein